MEDNNERRAGIDDAQKRLQAHIEQMPERYRDMPHRETLQRRAPDKWSKQEILGHLVDSALNNLKRFTEIQFLPSPYQVISYQQVNLVTVNQYQQAAVDHLLELWGALNKQIVFVLQNLPADKLNARILTPGGEQKDLGWLIIDYVDHMEHHFRQLFPD